MKRALASLCALGWLTAAYADFQAGVAAYRDGDFETARLEFEALAQEGVAQAQHNLGVMHEEGAGVPRDARAAAKWYRMAAEKGYPLSQNNLASLYEAGEGVPHDAAEAARLYRAAAEQGFVLAQYNLGTALREGRGVSRDLSEARKWLEAAADQGDEDASRGLRALAKAAQTTPAAPAAAPADDDVADARKVSIRTVQARLTTLGYDPGPVDGMMGPKTRTAIERFQRESGLERTGEPTLGLLERLDKAVKTLADSG